MKIISINAGSSSLKFQLFNMDDETVLASGLFERIGIEGSCYSIKYTGKKVKEEIEMKDHSDAVKILLDKLISLNIISSFDEIDAVGHRTVHGRDKYTDSVLITDEVIEDIDKFKEFAPIHNPANLLGIKAFKEVLPNVPMVAVFDTAFHQTIDEVNYLYPVPYKWYTDYQVRKYGFHGTSHKFIAKTLAEKLGRDDLKIISCHLGQGASLAAIKNGKCVDTSMGFTPLTGVIMGTRSGDVDASIIPFVMEKEGKNVHEVLDDLNKKSGFLGISQYSSDSRDIEQGITEGKRNGVIAEEKFVRSVVNYIAQYYVLLEGVDVIAFTAGIGENSINTRLKIVEELACLGIKIDIDANNVRGEFKRISTPDSKSEVYIVPTNEELMIARDTKAIIENR